MESLLADLRRISTAFALISMLPTAASAGTGFLQGWNLPEGADSHWVALGDVDGDFDIDAYVTEFYGPDVLWLNDGDGLFSRSAQVLDSGYGSCALLAPLDNNGSLDLWLARHLASNRVWFNDGAGTLADSSEAKLTAWMHQHLSLAVYQCVNQDELADLQERVMKQLDPPLNVFGMPASDVRVKVSQLRKLISD